MHATFGSIVRSLYGVAAHLTAAMAILVLLPALAAAQQRDLPEEYRALAVLCSSGASVKFRGEIEGGINKLFGKIVSGTGDLDISKSESAFLSSFKDDALKVEARRIYNECVLGALQIVFNKRDEPAPHSASSVRLLVPGEIATIKAGQRFALADKGSALLEQGGVIAAGPGRGSGVTATITNNGSGNSGYLDIGGFLRVPRTPCTVTFYQKRETKGAPQNIYSFLYQCEGENGSRFYRR